MLVNCSKTGVPLWPSNEGAGLIYSARSPLLASKLHRGCQADTPASKPLQRSLESSEGGCSSFQHQHSVQPVKHVGRGVLRRRWVLFAPWSWVFSQPTLCIGLARRHCEEAQVAIPAASTNSWDQFAALQACTAAQLSWHFPADLCSATLGQQPQL